MLSLGGRANELFPVWGSRILAFLATLGQLSLGIYCALNITASRAARAESLMRSQSSLKDAQSAAMARSEELKRSTLHFEASLKADITRLGLKVALDEVKSVQKAQRLLSSRRELGVGQALTLGPLKMKVVHDSLSFKRGGAVVKSQHTLLDVQNIGQKPIAYWIRGQSSNRGDCQVRGTRQHNVMVLAPGERAELTICAGKSAVTLTDVRVMETTMLGYHYLTQLPPQAVGHDPVVAQAHIGNTSGRMCTRVPAVKLANEIRAGRLHWEDVVDFYARHSCERVQMPFDYVRATAPLERLPAEGVRSANFDLSQE